MTSPIVLVLPYPVSANVYWRQFTIGKRVMSAPSSEATKYKREVAKLALAAGIRAPISGRVRVHIALYPQRPQDWQKRARRDPETWDNDVRCIDIDNARKCLYDALKNVLFDDDRWVWADAAERMEPDGEARVVVTITPISVQRAQAVIDMPMIETPPPVAPAAPVRKPSRAVMDAQIEARLRSADPALYADGLEF